jgi:putative oxidoreductase
MNKNIKLIGIILLLIIYLISGINKIFNFNNTVLKIKDMFLFNKLPLIFSKLSIIIVIITWIIGSITLIYSFYKEKRNLGIFFSCLIIILTTIITFYFHNPFDKTQTINFLKNLSIVGGFTYFLGDFFEMK